jgi:hypothetical protein
MTLLMRLIEDNTKHRSLSRLTGCQDSRHDLDGDMVITRHLQANSCLRKSRRVRLNLAYRLEYSLGVRVEHIRARLYSLVSRVEHRNIVLCGYPISSLVFEIRIEDDVKQSTFDVLCCCRAEL